ncbi:Thioredoxin-like fold protein [Moelleriella libera RCEF 2490]|uniref:Thioredoxin-like fold protein n=1 Tax=Moelleriella libera RCEF 2490 TaxID=1081109 RepID=A0A168E0H2_9HYPO|nr:Thioredoxin-like fold protein [Moelleriella libera RCEF 2490]
MVCELYADPTSINCRKVIAALHHPDADTQLLHTDYVPDQNKSSAYLKINPNGTISSAVVVGFMITESEATMQELQKQRARRVPRLTCDTHDRGPSSTPGPCTGSLVTPDAKFGHAVTIADFAMIARRHLHPSQQLPLDNVPSLG